MNIILEYLVTLEYFLKIDYLFLLLCFTYPNYFSPLKPLHMQIVLCMVVILLSEKNAWQAFVINSESVLNTL